MPEIDRLDPSSDCISKTLLRDGAVIVENAIPDDIVAHIHEDFRIPFASQSATCHKTPGGVKPRRVGAVLTYSRAAANVLANALVLSVADDVLNENCENYQIGATTAIDCPPGRSDQRLYRFDEVYPVRIPGVEFQVVSVVALTDFVEENGAPRVMLRTPETRNSDEIVPAHIASATMRRGSILFMLGSTWHGCGRNTVDKASAALVTNYSLGWLRQEENQYLSIPREVVDSYPATLQRLIGYQSHGRRLGIYPGDPDGHWRKA
ncbi:MAG: phytanoyl-CoA dioxygenase family protein [Rhodobacteraceae bacterium]|nr:phytanoyl-CoA dioxygenase family protein [Paracoccaceae bacterium]